MIRNYAGRLVIAVNPQVKDSHTFASGDKIHILRDRDNFDRRYTQPTQAVLISATHEIPAMSEVLIHHNAVDDVNRLFAIEIPDDHETLRYHKMYSVFEADVFAWKDSLGLWHGCNNYSLGLRVFQPYKHGRVQGIPPTKLKNVLYALTGTLKDKAVHVLPYSDYQLSFMHGGQLINLIRFRHFEDESAEREEVLAINLRLTQQVHDDTLLLGITENDAVPLSQLTLVTSS